MKPLKFNTLFTVLLLSTCSIFAQGTLDGDFVFSGFGVGFRVIPGAPESTKKIYGEHSSLSFGENNSFTVNINEIFTTLTVSNANHFGNDVRVNNAYVLSAFTESETGDDSATLAPNGVMEISDEDEVLRFFFNSTTNVAVQQILDLEEEPSMGFGVLIRKPTTPVNNATVEGTYTLQTMVHGFHQSPTNQADCSEVYMYDHSTMVLDGQGNTLINKESANASYFPSEMMVEFEGQMVSDTSFHRTPIEIEESTTNETYDVLADGTFLMQTAMGTFTNQLSADGDMIASFTPIRTPDIFKGGAFTVALRQPENRPTNAFDAVYYMVSFSQYFDNWSTNRNEVSSERGYIFLNSDGTFSIRFDMWDMDRGMYNWRRNFYEGENPPDYVSENVFYLAPMEGRFTEFETGTYSIAPNGIVTLHSEVEEDSISVQLSANGEYLLVGELNDDFDELEHFMGIGVRRIPPEIPAGPVRFTDIGPAENGALLTLSMPDGIAMECLYTDTLVDPYDDWTEWIYSGTTSISTNGTATLIDTGATNAPSRFYKAVFEAW
ncbi:MAG: hypothetical protein JXR40_00300 [Pontiellaceae bacterium]|nr:hypothetical protein [Pontiellaceae bacterium]